jgi:hypothetical protein
MKKHIIWSNMNLDIEDWREDYKESCENNDMEYDPDDEYAIYEWMMETNKEYFYDERMNLDKVVEGRILVIADLGLWNGRKSAYKIVESGNIRDILGFTYDCAEFYGDGYNIRGTEAHHDGTNHYLYRVIREDRNIQNLLDDIYDGKEYTMKKLNYYTKSLYKDVANVYGWR